MLLDTLYAATESTGAAVVVMDDLGAADEFVWSTLLYHAARFTDRRLLVVAGVNGPPTLTAYAPLRGWPPLLERVRAAGHARWTTARRRPAFSNFAVLSLLGRVDAPLARRLIAVSSGDSDVAGIRWQQWLRAGYVAFRGTKRRAVPSIADPIERKVHAVLTSRLPAGTTSPRRPTPRQPAGERLRHTPTCCSPSPRPTPSPSMTSPPAPTTSPAAGEVSLPVELGERAQAMATTVGCTPQRIQAARVCGQALHRAGYNANAVALLSESVDLRRE